MLSDDFDFYHRLLRLRKSANGREAGVFTPRIKTTESIWASDPEENVSSWLVAD
jgi:hypothetical protein